MKYLAAYCLATLSGKSNVTADDLSKIMKSVGIDVDNAEAKRVIDALQGKSLHEVISAGLQKVSTVAVGGGSSGGAATGGAAVEQKQEEAPKQEEEEEDDMDGGLDLFGF